jgi:MCP family monocarboxylic acid transporter-like MFS transporter 10
MRRRSTAVGIVVCGSGLAGVIYPIMMNKLFTEIGELLIRSLDLVWARLGMADAHLTVGFKQGMGIIAGMNALLMLPSWFFLKGRLPPRLPAPLKSLLKPWKEARFAFLVIGTWFMMMKCVSFSKH